MAEMTKSNRHPVDRLAEVRQEIKALKEIEDALRAEIISSKSFAGSEHIAQLNVSNRSVLDRKKLEATFGKVAVSACTTNSTTTTLRVLKRA